MNEIEEESFLIMIVRYQDGHLSESEIAEFDQTLRSDPEKRRLFIEVAKSSTGVFESLRQQAFAGNDQDEDRLVPFPIRTYVGRWAAAAVLALLLGWGGWLLREGKPVATVRQTNASNSLRVGDSLASGKVVQLDTGRIKVQFDSGALLAVIAPASFEVLGTNSARLNYGRATVRVPGTIKGFVLETQADRVVDLGTAFGVEVDPSGTTSLSVFEGEVQLSADRNLSAGQSVELVDARSAPKVIPYSESSFAETWQISFGIEALVGNVRLASPSERTVPGNVADSDSLLLFPERESVPLAQGYRVDAIDPGVHQRPFRKRDVQLRRDIRADSFLLQYNPARTNGALRNQRFAGEIRFDRPVVALVLQKDLLDASDSVLGLPQTVFDNVFRRGLNAQDKVTLSEDRRTLLVDLDVSNGVDQLRVLLQSHNRISSLP